MKKKVEQIVENSRMIEVIADHLLADHIELMMENESLKAVLSTRKPLTDSEIFNTAADYYEGYEFKALEFARAIERAHGITE